MLEPRRPEQFRSTRKRPRRVDDKVENTVKSIENLIDNSTSTTKPPTLAEMILADREHIRNGGRRYFTDNEVDMREYFGTD